MVLQHHSTLARVWLPFFPWASYTDLHMLQNVFHILWTGGEGVSCGYALCRLAASNGAAHCLQTQGYARIGRTYQNAATGLD